MDFRAFSLMAVFNLTALVTSDLFSDIESFDWDKKLKDLDTIINSVDTDDDDDDYNVGAGEGTDKSSMGDTLDMLSDLLGGGDECTYKCKNGNKPVPKPGHRPASNGCGSYGLQIDVRDIPGGTKCCNVHDFCYDTCNNARSTCDKQFQSCLHDACKKLKKTSSISLKDCNAASDILYSGAKTFGCPLYLEAQEKACTCPTRDSKSEPKKNGPKGKKEKSNSLDNESVNNQFSKGGNKNTDYNLGEQELSKKIAKERQKKILDEL